MECVFGMKRGPRYDRLQELLTQLMTLGGTPAILALSILVNGSRARELLVKRLAPLADRLAPLGHLDKAVPFGELARCLRDVDALLYEDIAERRASGTEGRADVMSMLIDARDEEGRGLTDQELRDEMMTLLIAGHETTATTLTFAMHAVYTRPEIKEAADEEIGRVVGRGPLTAEAIRELRYIDALIKETLRLYAPVPGFGRKLTEPMRLGGYDLPAGVIVGGSSYLLHRNPRIWPDPLRFDPRRFLDHKPRPGEFIPFGGGLRTCVGMAFAMFEAKVVIATMLTRAALRAAPAPPLGLKQRGIVYGPSHEAPFVLEGRSLP
jgi:cytochrome P450 family 110